MLVLPFATLGLGDVTQPHHRRQNWPVILLECIPWCLSQIPFQEWQWKVKVKVALQLFATPWLYSPWNSPGQNTGMGSRSLLQGIFPTQGSNPGLLQCRWIHYQLSHKGIPIELIFPTAGSSPSCWLSAQVLHKSYPWWEFLTQHHNSLLGQLLFVTHCFGGIKSQSLSPGCDNSKRPV